jgi:arylsulfatase A-like enzyme
MAFAFALGTAACRHDTDRRTVPLMRLADLRAARLGQHEAPAASIGETTRYVLADPRRVTGAPLDETALAAVRQGALAYTFHCPTEEAGRPLVIVLRGYAGAPADRAPRLLLEAALRRRCPPEDGGAVAVTFHDLPPTPIDSARVDLVLPPPRKIATGWIDLPVGARLETQVGLAGERGPSGARGALFSIRAANPTGDTATISEHRMGRVAAGGQDERPGAPESGGWCTLSASLDAVRARLGPRIRLLFEARPKGPSPLVPVWGDPAVVVERSDGDGRRPNVVLISLDTLRADHLGSYGYPGPVSPNLDRLAAEGVLFTDAVTLVNWTLPSHATMLTGVDPCVHGFRGARSGPIPRGLPPGVVPIAEILRRRGWITAAFTEDGYVIPSVFQRGFEEFSASNRPHDGRIEDTVALASAWLRRHAGDEFFLFLHTYQVHVPYDPPEPYRTRFAENRLHLPHAENAVAYAGEVAFTDEVIGRLIALIGELGIRDRTIVVVTSDHGESFGEHRWGEHGMSLHEEEVRVPLIWRAPGLAREGARVDGLTSLGDIVPTLVDMLGVPRPKIVTGLSRYDAIRAGAPVAAPSADRSLVLEGMTGRSVRTAAWKTIFGLRLLGQTNVSLFDLRQDPNERTPQAVARHDPTEAVLAEHEALCRRLRGEVGSAVGDTSPVDLDLRDRLRALGYAP